MKPLPARGHELNERDIELFNDTLERSTSGRRFFDRFYELFVTSSPEVAAVRCLHDGAFAAGDGPALSQL